MDDGLSCVVQFIFGDIAKLRLPRGGGIQLLQRNIESCFRGSIRLSSPNVDPIRDGIFVSNDLLRHGVSRQEIHGREFALSRLQTSSEEV